MVAKPKHECNSVVKDYEDLCLRLLPGQTRAKVNHVQDYFSDEESDQVQSVVLTGSFLEMSFHFPK